MKIGIVNDVDLAIQAIAATLNASGEHRVLWTASNGAEAIRLCLQNTPDLVLMDLVMPGMNGVEAIREIMRASPTAILVVTASITCNRALAFEAMGAGALNIIATPALANPAGRRVFLDKIAKFGAFVAEHHKLARPSRPRPSPPATRAVETTDTLVAIGC